MPVFPFRPTHGRVAIRISSPGSRRQPSCCRLSTFVLPGGGNFSRNTALSRKVFEKSHRCSRCARYWISPAIELIVNARTRALILSPSHVRDFRLKLHRRKNFRPLAALIFPYVRAVYIENVRVRVIGLATIVDVGEVLRRGFDVGQKLITVDADNNNNKARYHIWHHDCTCICRYKKLVATNDRPVRISPG